MKKSPLAVFVALSLTIVFGLTAVSFSQRMAEPGQSFDSSSRAAIGSDPLPYGQTGGWSMAFSEEFNSPPVDATKWTDCIYWGREADGCWENVNQLEWYLPKNVTIANGIATIRGQKETLQTSQGTKYYTSGFISTDSGYDNTQYKPKFEFTYGYAEIKAQLPAGKGLWPAFWLLPSDHREQYEIDIMENLGHEPSKIYMVNHNNVGEDVEQSSSYTGPNFSTGYHYFAVDWQPDHIIWYVDGVERFKVTDKDQISNLPMYLIANLQIGGPWPGSPDSSTVFPANYNIDHIRVWKKSATPTITSTLPSNTPVPTRVPTSIPVPTIIISPSTNLINNGNFTTGTTGWGLDSKINNGAFVTWNSADASAKVDIKRTSSTSWNIQFLQKQLPLKANSGYKLTFSAKSTSSRNIPVIIQQYDSPYTEYFRKSINIPRSNRWYNYELTFTSPVDLANAKLSFALAQNRGTIWFDNVSMVEQ